MNSYSVSIAKSLVIICALSIYSQSLFSMEEEERWEQLSRSLVKETGLLALTMAGVKNGEALLSIKESEIEAVTKSASELCESYHTILPNGDTLEATKFLAGASKGQISCERIHWCGNGCFQLPCQLSLGDSWFYTLKKRYEESQKGTIITGPNAAGKLTVLKD